MSNMDKVMQSEAVSIYLKVNYPHV
jgi:hypothetical protein